MELRDYARTKRRWVIPLIAVPILAGAVTGVLLARQPASSTALVQLLVPPDQSNSDSQIGLYLAKFEEALRSDDVQQQVVEQADVRVADLQTGLDVSRVGQSDQLVLSLTSTASPTQTLAAARAAAQAGAVHLAQSSGGDAQGLVEVAGTALSQAQVELIDFESDIGNTDLTGTYQALVASLAAAQVQLAAAEAEGDEEAVGQAQAQIDALTARQTDLLPLLEQQNLLRARVAAAEAQLRQVAQSAVLDQTRLAAAESGQRIQQSSVVSDERSQSVAEGVGLAVLVALVGVLGVSLVPDLLRAQGRRTIPARTARPGIEHYMPRHRSRDEEDWLPAGAEQASTRDNS